MTRNPEREKRWLCLFTCNCKTTGWWVRTTATPLGYSTTIRFGYGSTGIVSDVLVDGSSGNKRAVVTRDEFGLPSRLIVPLAIAIYRVCGRDMRAADCD